MPAGDDLPAAIYSSCAKGRARHKLGTGAWASVYEVKRLSDGRPFACKRLNKNISVGWDGMKMPQGLKAMREEVAAMRILSGKHHVIKLYAVCEGPNWSVPH